MQVVFNPKDTNTFASASLDRSIKVWNIGSSVPNYTLEGHDKGVNCIDYYQGGEKPYLVSGADDRQDFAVLLQGVLTKKKKKIFFLIGWSRSGTIRTRLACRPLRATVKTCRLSRSTPSSLSSSAVQKMVKRKTNGRVCNFF